MNCQKCGKELAPDDEFCTQCGIKVEKAAPPGEEKAYCSKCGNELTPGEGFCSHCGAPVKPAEEVQGARAVPIPPAPKGPEAPPGPAVPPAAPGAAPFAPPEPAKKSKKTLMALVVGIVGLLVIVAIVLVLVLVVFKGTGPEQVVDKLFEAEKSTDINAVMDILDTDYFQNNPEMEKAFKDKYYQGISGGITVSGLKYETKVSGDTATVKVVEGSETYEREGKKITEDYSKEPWTIDLVKKGGQWYISPSTFGWAFASDYMEQADAIYESFRQKAEAFFNGFDEFMTYCNSTPYIPPYQPLQDRINGLSPQVAPIKSEGDRAKAAYQKVLDLQGGDLEDYKAPAKLTIEYIDTAIQRVEVAWEEANYMTNASATIDQYDANAVANYNNNVSQYDSKRDELYNKGEELINKRNEYTTE